MNGQETIGEFIAYVARVSNPANQSNNLTAPKLLKYLLEHKHWSPFEMADVTFEIVTTRDIGRQILRHRSFSFQEFCVAEGTKIRMKTGYINIENLYKRQKNKQYSDMSNWLVKVYDEDTKTFVFRKINEVFNTGIKDIYKITLDNNKIIETTKDHKLFSFNGFKRVEELSKNDFIGCNGVPLYQDKDWLFNAKKLSIESKGGLQFIADLAGVKYVTIRKWLKKFGLQFSKKGKDNNLYTGTEISWRKYVAYECSKYKKELLQKQNYKCAISGKQITEETCDIDHIFPVYSRPELALELSNLQLLEKNIHLEKTKKETLESKKTARFIKIKNIEYCGKKQTYDIEVDHKSHNYIANGIITHNSQRYADPTKLGFTIREARLQDTKNRQNSIETDDDTLSKEWREIQYKVTDSATEAYIWAIENGIAKEQARAVLPEGLTLSRMYMKGSLRSWVHYCMVRCANGTQKEHMDIAREIWKQLCEIVPELRSIEIDGFSLEEHEIYANLNDILQEEIDKEVIQEIMNVAKND